MLKKPDNLEIIQLFRSKAGRKKDVAEALNVSRPTLDKWINEDNELKEAVSQQNEDNIDWVESKLFELINGVTVQTFSPDGTPNIYTQTPNVTAIIFYLKTKGKSRGYVERQEIVAQVDAKEAVFNIAGQQIPFEKKT